MLVAVSGSQGCGKTTVLNEIAKLGYKVIERKTSRSILDEWGVTLDQVNCNHELTVRFQDEIIKRKVADETDALNNNEIVFTERTFADIFTYTLVSLGKENKYSEWIDSYFETCARNQQMYDAVFYLKAGMFKVEKDGVRGFNRHYSTMVDLTMFEYTKRMTTKESFYPVETADLEERTAIICYRARGLRALDTK